MNLRTNSTNEMNRRQLTGLPNLEPNLKVLWHRKQENPINTVCKYEK